MRRYCAVHRTFHLVAPLLALSAGAGCPGPRGDASRVLLVFGATGMGRGEFAYPRGLSVSPVDGRIFVVDKAARIQRFDPQGRYETEWRMPEYENGKPTGLCVDRKNQVWVADTHYSRVIIFDREGRERRRFGEPGEGPGQFVWPTNLTFDADGNVYVAEHGGNDRISRFSPDLGYQFSFAQGDPETGGTSRPQSLAFDRQGVLWVADAAHHRICRYTREGRFLGAMGAMGTGPGEFHYPYSIAVRDDQTLLVSDYGNNRIVQWDPSGRPLGAWGSAGREVGQIRHAWSLDLGPDGRLYVLDSWNDRVQALSW